MHTLSFVTSVAAVLGMAGNLGALDAKVEVLALQVGKVTEYKPEKMMYNQGTSLTLLITQHEKFFISLDTDATKVMSFTDDKGTDLLQEKGRWELGPISFPKTSDDGRQCFFEVKGNGTPAKGAKEVRLKAGFVLKCGQGEKSQEQRNVAIAKGSKITVGPVPMTIDDVGKDDWGGALSVQMSSKGDLDRIKKIEFIGPDGKEVESSISTKSSFSIGDSKTNSRTYSLKKKVDQVTVRVTYYEKIEAITIPVDLGIGVGL